jgi:DNA-binding MarR family transcriptional regulator
MTNPKSKRAHSESLLNLIIQLVKFCQEKEQYFANLYNLTTVELRSLQYFKTNPCTSVKELSIKMGLTPGRITHIITSLEKKKLITREIDETDRRSINVCLTSKAIPFAENLNKSYIELHEKILENIPIEKREPIINTLEELVKAFKTWNEKR